MPRRIKLPDVSAWNQVWTSYPCRCVSWLLLGVLALSWSLEPVSAQAQSEQAAAEALSSTPLEGRDDFALRLDEARFRSFAATAPGVRNIKFVYDRRPEDKGTPRIYFLNSRVYELHINFIRQNKLVAKDQIKNVQLESWRLEDRRFFFAQLAWYEDLGGQSRYVLELFDEDKASAKLITELYEQVTRVVELGTVYFKPNSLEQETRRADLVAARVPMLENDALNANRLFQVVHAGKPAVGRLRVVEETDPTIVESMIFNRNEIILLQTIPNDITRVAGILTTRPTTPLSHVSLRARTWDIPNIMMREALSLAYKEGLADQWVRLEVLPSGLPSLRKATPQEVEAAETERSKTAPSFRIPRADLEYSALTDLFALRTSDVTRYGAKAANLGELAALTRELPLEDIEPLLKQTEGTWLADTLGKLPLFIPRSPARRAKAYLSKLHVPPGFAVPFAAYQSFLNHPDNRSITTFMEQMLKEEKFHRDAIYRRQQLDALQELIRSGTFPPEWQERILNRLAQDLPDRRVFVRSSTNSEDLEGFNGAGLYETVGNVEGNDAVVVAIKRVWASIWNFKAYEARQDFGIDHRAVYPGVLIQEAVRPYAAGVLITKDVLSRKVSERYYINANPGFGENVVNSGRGAPEQVYGDPITGQVMRISLSERGGALLTDAEVRQLVFFSAVVERHFARLVGRFPHPQDIEWLVVDGRVSIVQARPYLEPD